MIKFIFNLIAATLFSSFIIAITDGIYEDSITDFIKDTNDPKFIKNEKMAIYSSWIILSIIILILIYYTK